MKKYKKYTPLKCEVKTLSPCTLLASSIPAVTTVTSVPITLPKDNVSVEDFQPGFTDGGVDFKDLSF